MHITSSCVHSFCPILLLGFQFLIHALFVVLQPCLKQKYMQQLKWLAACQDEAIDIMRGIWQLIYAAGSEPVREVPQDQ